MLTATTLLVGTIVPAKMAMRGVELTALVSATQNVTASLYRSI